MSSIRFSGNFASSVDPAWCEIGHPPLQPYTPYPPPSICLCCCECKPQLVEGDQMTCDYNLTRFQPAIVQHSLLYVLSSVFQAFRKFVVTWLSFCIHVYISIHAYFGCFVWFFSVKQGGEMGYSLTLLVLFHFASFSQYLSLAVLQHYYAEITFVDM